MLLLATYSLVCLATARQADSPSSIIFRKEKYSFTIAASVGIGITGMRLDFKNTPMASTLLFRFNSSLCTLSNITNRPGNIVGNSSILPPLRKCMTTSQSRRIFGSPVEGIFFEFFVNIDPYVLHQVKIVAFGYFVFLKELFAKGTV